jgi:protein TonB
VDTLAVPRIPGGLRALPQFLATNLHYPPEAFRLDIQGQVSIEFVVETSGTISNLRTLNFLGGGCDTEAMRLARTICWIPAVKNGKHVRSIMKLDIQFRLDPSRR